MRHPRVGMSDHRLEDLSSSLRQRRNPRLDTKAVLSAVLPLVLGGLTVLSFVLGGANLAIAYAVGISDLLAGACCVALAAWAWRLIRRTSGGGTGLVWTVAGATLSLGLIALGLMTIALATALNNLTIPPF